MQANIRYTVYPPSADLAHAVKHYFLYENGEQSWQKEYALSDGTPGMCFALDSPYQIVEKPGETAMATYSFICGAFTKGIYIQKYTSLQTMFGVKFTIDGLYHLIKTPAVELRQKPVWNADEVLGNELTDLTEQIRTLPHVSKKIEFVETYLRGVLHYNTKSQEMLFLQAIEYIKKTKGQSSIEGLATQLNVNYKWLERKFSLYIGISPKDFVRLIRFIHTYFDFKKEGNKDLLNVAIANGFYDQAHFIKEFKYFTTYTPTELLNKPVNDLAHIMKHYYKL